MRAYIDRKKRQDFVNEVRKQSKAIAARAADPNSDDAAILRELDANLAGLANEWK